VTKLNTIRKASPAKLERKYKDDDDGEDGDEYKPTKVQSTDEFFN